MAKLLNHGKMTDIIRKSVQETIDRTEELMQNTKEAKASADTVSIMVNGIKKTIKKEDYEKLWLENKKTKQQMKTSLRALKTEYKENLKQETKL